ncbi:acyl carrier protein [Singulisphaera rosea]
MIPFIVIVAVFLILAAIVIVERGERSKFEDRFPPISDDEFVARCGPGTNREIALKVRRIVSDQLGVEYERIHPSASFVNDLGAD